VDWHNLMAFTTHSSTGDYNPTTNTVGTRKPADSTTVLSANRRRSHYDECDDASAACPTVKPYELFKQTWAKAVGDIGTYLSFSKTVPESNSHSFDIYHKDTATRMITGGLKIAGVSAPWESIPENGCHRRRSFRMRSYIYGQAFNGRVKETNPMSYSGTTRKVTTTVPNLFGFSSAGWIDVSAAGNTQYEAFRDHLDRWRIGVAPLSESSTPSHNNQQTTIFTATPSSGTEPQDCRVSHLYSFFYRPTDSRKNDGFKAMTFTPIQQREWGATMDHFEHQDAKPSIQVLIKHMRNGASLTTDTAVCGKMVSTGKSRKNR